MDKLLLLVKLSENEKRILIAALLLFIILLVLIGLIVSIIKKVLSHYAHGIDTYVADMLNYKVLTKPAAVRKYVAFREGRTLVKKLLIPTYVFIGISIFYAIFAIRDSISLNDFFNHLSSLGFKLDWPMEKFFGLKIVNDWPAVASYPSFNANHLYIYFYAFSVVIYGVYLMRRTLIYVARRRRAAVMSRKVFSKDLDNMRFESQ